jgi:hypothetical protein
MPSFPLLLSWDKEPARRLYRVRKARIIKAMLLLRYFHSALKRAFRRSLRASDAWHVCCKKAKQRGAKQNDHRAHFTAP